jgi:CO/xanthine dehydrogenase Mo-binding subunit
LDVDISNVRIISADTRQGPDEGYTYGSQSIEQSGTALRAASAQARAILLGAAATKLNVKVARLSLHPASSRLRAEHRLVGSAWLQGDDATYRPVRGGSRHNETELIRAAIRDKRHRKVRFVHTWIQSGQDDQTIALKPRT